LEETLSVSTLDTDSTPRDPAPSLADDRAADAQDRMPQDATPPTSASPTTRTPAQILGEWRAAERELADNPADLALIDAIQALRDEFERATESRR